MKVFVLFFVLFVSLLSSTVITATPRSLASIPDSEISDGFLFTRDELLDIKHSSAVTDEQKEIEAFFCSSYANTDCLECTSHTSLGGCYWCPSTGQCQGTLTLSECPGLAWLHDTTDCAILNNTLSGNPELNSTDTCSEPYDVGCSDNDAYNYKIRATRDDGSCLYKSNHSSTIPNCSDNCVCESGGVAVPYGKYCGKGYTGCSTQQPCDQLDRCCQVHDWCVGQESYLSCDCNYQLLQCVESMTQEDIDNSFCPEYVKNTMSTIITEVRSVILGDCLGASPQPVCDYWINCYGRGTCNFDAGCTCDDAYGAVYFYDAFNRTDCSCAPGYGPPCGSDACTIYGYSSSSSSSS